MAEEWIAGQAPACKGGKAATFAICLRTDRALVGAIGLQIDRDLEKAELGYWVGRPFWNRGYATEAASAVLDFGFDKLRLNRIQAAHLSRNPSSGRVLEKVGMLLEGTARQGAKKWGEFEDVVWYGVLRDDWAGGAP